MNFIKQCGVISMLALYALTACTREAEQAPVINYPEGYTGRIQYQLEANYNFFYYTKMQTDDAPWLKDTLRADGPYTLLVMKSDQLFYYSYWDVDYAVGLMNYLIIPGKQVFKTWPAGRNQPLKTLLGPDLYFSKYVNGSDTVMTINGTNITSADNEATNGTLQVISTIIPPALYSSLSRRISGDPDLSMFSAAIARAGIDAALDKDTFTVMAPLNAAFANANTAALGLGISTMDSLLRADPVMLKALVQNHIIKGKYFSSDMQDDFKKNNNDTVCYPTLSGHDIKYYYYFYSNGINPFQPAQIKFTNTQNQPINNEVAGKSVVNRITEILAL